MNLCPFSGPWSIRFSVCIAAVLLVFGTAISMVYGQQYTFASDVGIGDYCNNGGKHGTWGSVQVSSDPVDKTEGEDSYAIHFSSMGGFFFSRGARTDFSEFATGYLCFSLKTTQDFMLKLEADTLNRAILLSNFANLDGSWEEVVIPLDIFTSRLSTLSNISVPFGLHLGQNRQAELKLDNIRFVNEVSLPQYTIGIIPPAGGGSIICAQHKVYEGHKQIVYIVPDKGYRIKEVFVDDKSVGRTYAYEFKQVKANHTISATFEIGPAYETYEDLSLEVTDNFDTYNSELWDQVQGTFEGNLCWFNGSDNFTFGHGLMSVQLRQESAGGREYTSGELRSKAYEYHYGRYEVRMRCPFGSGYAATMFTFNTQFDTWDEIDLEIEGMNHNQLMCNTWSGGPTLKTRIGMGGRYPDPSNPTSPVFDIHDWTVYSFDWLPGAIIYYVNGLEVFRSTRHTQWVNGYPPSTDNPAQLIMNFWITAYGYAFGGPNDGNVYPLTLDYDYFKYYKLAVGQDLPIPEKTQLNPVAAFASTQMQPASFAIDGLASTRWESTHGIDPSWIYVDLGSVKAVEKVEIAWEAANAQDFDIEFSTDATTWSDAVEVRGKTFGNRTDVLNFAPRHCRYVRVQGISRPAANAWGYSIFELRIFGGSDETTIEQRLTPLSAQASSAESVSLRAANAIDANASTRWSSLFSDPQWISLDLGQSYPISRITLSWETACAKEYRLEVSEDGSIWTTVENITVGDGGIDDFAGLNLTGRYVRMWGIKRATPWGYSLWEFSVWTTKEIVPVQTCTVNATAGSHGSITPSGAVRLRSGADVTFGITPDPGYRVDQVSVDGVAHGPLDSYRFSSLDADHTIEATFKPGPPPAVIVSSFNKGPDWFDGLTTPAKRTLLKGTFNASNIEANQNVWLAVGSSLSASDAFLQMDIPGLSGLSTLVVACRSANFAASDVTVGLFDGVWHELPLRGVLTDAYQDIAIPLADFTGLSLADVSSFRIWFKNPGGEKQIRIDDISIR